MPRPDWPTAAPFIPSDAALPALAAAAEDCRGCPLWEPATHSSSGPRGKRRIHATPDTWEVRACTPWPPSGDESRYGDGQVLATLHPSAVLRSDDREAARAGLVADLRVAADALGS